MNTFELYVDEKVTVWRRSTVTVEAETLEEAVQRCVESSYDEVESEYMYDTEDYLSPQDNKGCSTFEILNPDDEETLYDNKQTIDQWS